MLVIRAALVKESMIYTESCDSYPSKWWVAPTTDMMKDPDGLCLDFHGTACKSTSLQPDRTIPQITGKELTEEEEEKMEKIKINIVPLYLELKKEVKGNFLST